MAQRLARPSRWTPLEIVFWLVAAGGDLAPAEPAPHPDGDRDPRAVRALARPDPRLRRHHLARTRGVLRIRRLCRRPDREARARHRARAGARARGSRRGGAGLRDELPRAARIGPHATDGDARRGAGAARDRQPLLRPHRRCRRPAGHHHGAGARASSSSTSSATPRTSTASSCCSCCSSSRAASCNSPFGLSLRSIKGNALRASADRHSGRSPPRSRSTRRRVLRRRGGRAADADHGVRVARRILVRPLGRPAAGADHRRHAATSTAASSARSCSS